MLTSGTSPQFSIPGTIDVVIGMLSRVFSKASLSRFALLLSACLLLMGCFGAIRAQVDTLDEDAADPLKLFERGQNAHGKGDLERAIAYYDEALKMKPEFPEAEFQKGNALASLKKFSEAENAFRRAIQLRANWSLPYVSLGVLLARSARDNEARVMLKQALALEGQNTAAVRAMADIQLRAGETKEALELLRQATAKDPTPETWIARAIAERKLGLRAEAAASLDHVLNAEPNYFSALLERAELRIDEGNWEAAIKDLREAEKTAPKDKAIAARLAYALTQAGQADAARAVAQNAGLISQQSSEDRQTVIGAPEEIEAANSPDAEKAKKALLSLLEKNPNSAMLMARLGASYRTEDPAKSLEYFRRAAELKPKDTEYAVGYAAALVQQRRFGEATAILRRVIAMQPDNYTAHANLATALYAQKSFADALLEYDWIVKNKPELAIAYYFIATAHDNLGQYQEALAAYENFLSRADAQTNQLEIDKVKLRLPMLRRQIQLGQGVKRKPSD